MDSETPTPSKSHPMRTVALGSYSLFCCLPLISSVIPKNRVFGELSDVLMMTGIAWPYPLLLALQRFIQPESWAAFLAADLFGFGLIAAAVWVIEARMGPRAKKLSIAIPLGLTVGPILLGAFELLLVSCAFAAGWPVGE